MHPALFLAALGVAAAPVTRSETRCGWLDNTTPANMTLKDRDGEWLISQQGGYQAPGIDGMPDMSTRGVVSVNRSYGYSCACMVVISDKAQRRIRRIISGRPVPLRQCRSDRRLPRP